MLAVVSIGSVVAAFFLGKIGGEAKEDYVKENVCCILFLIVWALYGYYILNLFPDRNLWFVPVILLLIFALGVIYGWKRKPKQAKQQAKEDEQ